MKPKVDTDNIKPKLFSIAVDAHHKILIFLKETLVI